MRIYALLALGVLAAAELPAVSITSQETAAGMTSTGAVLYQFTYQISNLTLQSNEELDIYFDPTVYAELSNVVVSSQFQYVLFQPSASPAAPGDFGVVPIANNTVTTGPFDVSFTLVDQLSAGPQFFTVSEFSPSGGLIGVVASGMTSLASAVVTPEPAAIRLTGLALLLSTMCGVGRLLAGRRYVRRISE